MQITIVIISLKVAQLSQERPCCRVG